MNLRCSVWAILLLVVCAAPVPAQPDEPAGGDERDPSHKHWQWYFPLRLPEQGVGPYLALPIPPQVFGKASGEITGREMDELRDLRLADAKGKRVPYALRILRDEYKQSVVPIVRQFNAAPSPKSRIFEASYELAPLPAPGHNEIEIRTAGGGRNHRRKVEVFGDDDDHFTKPKSLLGKGKYLVFYDVDGKIVDMHRFRYDFMQYRYLQVRVHADEVAVDEEIPTITGITVRRTIEVPGEYVTEQASLGVMEQVRGDGGPATAWLVGLPDRMPCEKLIFEIVGEPSERPLRLQIADPDQPRSDVSGVEWRWRRDDQLAAEDRRHFLEARFSEVSARRLRIVVTDFANEPLRISKVEVTRCVRKLIFEKPDPATTTLPLWLLAGNPLAAAARYDLAQKLPMVLNPPPPVATLESSQLNPAYEPPPQELHERMPWLVHLVLGAASLILLVILAALARQAITRHDRAQPLHH